MNIDIRTHNTKVKAEMQFDQKDLRLAFSQFPTGVAVVTAASAHGHIGMTVNSLTTLSLEPALISWAIGQHSSRYTHFSQAHHMSIHILAAHQMDLCKSFARNAHAFESVDWRLNQFDTPIFDHVAARFDVICVNEVKVGDHILFINQVMNYEVNTQNPLIFSQGKFMGI